ncbi:hypothetical protein K438DRAFT_1781113 [Mycena galopus ATCC 62051]|nr:hypothetical protein K438DRAFT_1781113 [Mycena galopus ATCC 62051]
MSRLQCMGFPTRVLLPIYPKTQLGRPGRTAGERDAGGVGEVLWFKETFLEDGEIIEHLVHNETRRIHWTMHRPQNIRIHTPPACSSHHFQTHPTPPSALLFESHTNAPIPHTNLSNLRNYPGLPWFQLIWEAQTKL